MNEKAYLLGIDPEGNIPFYQDGNKLSLIHLLADENIKESLEHQVQEVFNTTAQNIAFRSKFEYNNQMDQRYLVRVYLGNLKEQPVNGVYLPVSDSLVHPETKTVLDVLAEDGIIDSFRNYQRTG